MPKRNTHKVNNQATTQRQNLFESIDIVLVSTIYFSIKFVSFVTTTGRPCTRAMSLTLGEKLRQAREERGISIAEVAEQTRISPHYIQSIEEDNYKTLPGGIFNKGFVKSFAKYVEIDEQEALKEYAQLISSEQGGDGGEPKVYRPEVLTDDRSGSSMIPTVVVAVIILGLMTVGILYLVDYVRNRSAGLPGITTANSNIASSNANVPAATPEPATPALADSTFEFKASGSDISLLSVVDGKSSTGTVKNGETVTFNPKESLKLSYSRSLVEAAQLSINGKPITLPMEPFNPQRRAIEIEFTNSNFPEIWKAGTLSTVGAAANDPEPGLSQTSPTAVSTPGAAVSPEVRPSITPKPAATKPATPKATPNAGKTQLPANRPAANRAE